MSTLTLHSLTAVQHLLLPSFSPDNQVNTKRKDIQEAKTNLEPIHEPARAHTDPSCIVDGKDAVHSGWVAHTKPCDYISTSSITKTNNLLNPKIVKN